MTTHVVDDDEAERLTFHSRDGTPIACWKRGAGPPLVLVHGTTSDHQTFRFVEPFLQEQFTLYAIDRRGRGESGDAAEYAIAREFEDLAAVVDALAEPAGLLGHSFGATCALGAAPLARNLCKLVLYEATPGVTNVPTAAIDRIDEQIRRGERDAAIRWMFREVLELSEKEVEELSAAPTWAMRVKSAHTVPREFRAEAEYRPDPDTFRSVTAPCLQVLGSESPSWARQGAEAVRALLPAAKEVVLPGQGHLAIRTAPELFATEVARFLSDG